MKHQKLVDRIISLLESSDIECYDIQDNVKMKELGISTDDPNKNIEFDIMALAENIGIIFEVSTKEEKNEKKIKQFLNKARQIVKAHKSKKLNLNVFSQLSDDIKNRLTDVREWKFVYVGTGQEIENRKMEVYPVHRNNKLIIINNSLLEYLEYLQSCIGIYAKNDVFYHFGINPKDPEKPGRPIEPLAIKMDNKKISGNIDADVFLFQLPALDLLYLADVPRFGYDVNGVYEKTNYNYQRMLKKNKLTKIVDLINTGKRSYSFPNTVTLVLPKTKRVSNKNGLIKKISIPYIRKSIRIIDGQHRIFGYAKSNLSKEDLADSKIMAVGLSFHNNSTQKKDAARIFVEINREQTRVPNNQLLLISYPILGDTKPKALSAYVLSKLNEEEKGPLQNILATKPTIKKKRSQSKPIEIIMISNELSKIFKFDKKIKKGKHDVNIKYLTKLTSDYFKIIKNNFDEDWQNQNSLIFSSKYMAAFVRLLVEYRKRKYGRQTIGKKIAQMRKKLIKTTSNVKSDKTDIIFSTDNKNIPSIGEDQHTIIEFILKHGLNKSERDAT